MPDFRNTAILSTKHMVLPNKHLVLALKKQVLIHLLRFQIQGDSTKSSTCLDTDLSGESLWLFYSLPNRHNHSKLQLRLLACCSNSWEMEKNDVSRPWRCTKLHQIPQLLQNHRGKNITGEEMQHLPRRSNKSICIHLKVFIEILKSLLYDSCWITWSMTFPVTHPFHTTLSVMYRSAVPCSFTYFHVSS